METLEVAWSRRTSQCSSLASSRPDQGFAALVNPESTPRSRPCTLGSSSTWSHEPSAFSPNPLLYFNSNCPSMVMSMATWCQLIVTFHHRDRSIHIERACQVHDVKMTRHWLLLADWASADRAKCFTTKIFSFYVHALANQCMHPLSMRILQSLCFPPCSTMLQPVVQIQISLT